MNFNELNNEQKTAVTQQGNVLLTACPGSGKTRAIIHKLVYELSRLENSDKKWILALTFTNRASEEIFRRLNKMGINSAKVWSSTLHSFCLEWIIKPYSCYLPELNNGYTIADETYCDELVSQLKEKHNLKQIDSVNFRFNRDGTFSESKSNQKKLLEEYHSILKSEKLIDFELLLYYSYLLLKKHTYITKTLSHLFKLICVDEYQDTQDLLYAIILLIVKTGNGTSSVFMVGDTDQAIYGSLGGVAKDITEIRQELEKLEISPLKLSGNYRSNQRIIDFYSNFQTNKIKIDALGKNANEKGIISFNDTISHTDLVSEISRLIEYSLRNGIDENEICVLVPQWWLITNITKKLRASLPSVNFDASGLAPMSKNRNNIWYKLSRLFLTEPSPKIYSTRYRWANELIEEFNVHTNMVFNEYYSNPRNLLRLINSISSDKEEGIEYLEDCFNRFTTEIGINYKEYPILIENRKLYFENIQNRLNDPTFKVPSDINSFKSFYREMNGVVINTCVGVKGEEFETVIAFGLLNGYVPHWNDIFAKTGHDAAMKLLYVICSRAKTNLHLISERGRKTKNGTPLITTPELNSIKFQYDEV